LPKRKQERFRCTVLSEPPSLNKPTYLPVSAPPARMDQWTDIAIACSTRFLKCPLKFPVKVTE
jgi:hypothetical protein